MRMLISMNKRSIFFFFVLTATILVNIGYASINAIHSKISGTLTANQPTQLFIKSVTKLASQVEVSDSINSYEGRLLNTQITLGDDKENIDNGELSSYINFVFNPVASYMKNLIVSKYTNGGTSDDLTNIDLENMAVEERTEMFEMFLLMKIVVYLEQLV